MRTHQSARFITILSVLLPLAGSCTGDAMVAPVVTETAEAKKGGGVAASAPGTVVLTPAEAGLRVGDTLTLAAEVRNAAGHVVPNQPVTLASSDAEVASVTDVGLVTALSAGQAVITGKRNNRSGTATITVLRWLTAMTGASGPEDPRVGQALTFSATLTREDGTPLAEKPVDLALSDGTILTATTGETGQASFEVTDLPEGSYTYTLAFAGDVANDPSAAEGTVSVRKWRTAISLDPTQTRILVGEDASFTATLLREDGEPLAGQALTLQAGPLALMEGTTDDQGSVTFLVEGLPAGQHDLTASFAGDDANEASGAGASIAVGKWDTQLEVSPASQEMRVGETGSVSVTLTRVQGGTPLAGKDITVMVDGTPVAGLATGADGVAVFEVAGLVAGGHTIQFAFAEDDENKRTGGDARVTVTKWETRLTASPTAMDLRVGESAPVRVEVTRAADGLALAGRAVELSMSGVALESKGTDGQGVVVFDVSAPSAGTHSLGFSIQEDEATLGSSTGASLSARKWVTSLTATDVRGSAGGSTVLETRLVREDGQPVAGARVTFTVDGIPAGGADTDADGWARLLVSDLAGGVYSYDADFAPTEENEGSSARATVDAGAWPTTLAADDVVADASGKALLRATLLRSDGQPVENARIVFFRGTQGMASVQTDVNGVAEASIDRVFATTFQYTARFGGLVDELEPSEGTGTVEGAPWPTHFRILSDLQVPAGQVRVEAELRDAAGRLLSGKTVHLTAGSYEADATTVDGVVSFEDIGVTEDTDFTLSFAGDERYAASSVTESLDVGPWWTAQLTLRTQVQLQYKRALLIARLKDKDGRPIPGVPIRLEVDGVHVGTRTTNGYGQAYVRVTVNSGVYTFTASWAGSSTYFPVTTTGALNAGKFITTLLTEDIAADENGNAAFSARLTKHSDFPVGTPPVAGAAVTFTLEDGTTANATTDADGWARVTVPVAVGLQTFTAAFAGDAELQPASETGTVDNGRVPTVMTAEGGTATHSGPFTLKATLKTDANAPVVGRAVSFTTGATALGQASTDAGGVASLAIERFPLLPGSHTVDATFAGDNTYTTASKSAVLTVEPSPTTVEVTTGSTPWVNTQMAFALPVTDAGGDVTAPKSMDVSVDGTVVAEVRDVTGSPYVFRWTFTEPGPHTVHVRYLGDAGRLASETSTTIDIGLRPTTLRIDSAPGSVMFGQTVTLNGRIVSDQLRVVGVDISAYVDGAATPVATINTGSDFRFTISIDGLQTGTRSIRLVYAGDPARYLPSSATHRVTVNRLPTSMGVVVHFSGVRGDPATLDATLTAGGTPLSGRDISFRIGATVLGQATTDSQGRASLTTNIDLPAGFYTVTADFDGDAVYAPTSGSGSLNVGGTATQLTVVRTGTVTHDRSAGVIVRLTDASGTPLGSQPIEFTLGSQTYSATTNATGDAALPATGLTEGTYQGTAAFHATPAYSGSSVPIEVTVVAVRTQLLKVSAKLSSWGRVDAQAQLLSVSPLLSIGGRVLKFTFLGADGSVLKEAYYTTRSNGWAWMSGPSSAVRVTVEWAGDGFYGPAGPVTVNVSG